jgi:hypothetical protein
MKSELFRQNFDKYLNVKFDKCPSNAVGAELFRADRRAGGLTEGRTRHDEASSLFSQLCEKRLEQLFLRKADFPWLAQ